MRRVFGGIIVAVLVVLSGCFGVTRQSTLSGAVKIVTPSPSADIASPLSLSSGSRAYTFGRALSPSIVPWSDRPTYEYVVGFARGTDRAEMRRIVQQQGFVYVRGTVGEYHIVRDPQRRPAEAAIRLLESTAGVLVAMENTPVTPLASATDPAFAEQWALEAIRAKEAWHHARSVDAGGIIVAVVDTAIDFSQPDLDAPSLWVTGWDVQSGAEYGYDRRRGIQGDGHGTGVAGIIGAIAGNGYGIHGVAPGVRLMPIRAVFERAGVAHVAEGIAQAVERGAQIINLSFRVGTDPDCRPPLNEVLSEATASGVILVAAAGNDKAPIACPASHPSVIAVGAVDRHGRVTDYSASGADLDLVAPGGTSKDEPCIHGIRILGTEDRLACDIGTSFAAPHVSGVVALMLGSGFPQDPDKVRALLHMTAIRPDNKPGWDSSYGYGRLDALGAVAADIPRVMVVERLGDRLSVKSEAQPGPGGRFHMAKVPEGRWRLIGWIDVDGDGELSSGDYFGEFGPVVVRKGQSLTGLELVLEPYEGERFAIE